MKKWLWVMVLALSMVLVLTGCGPKSAEDVISRVDKRVEKMESYKGQGKMTLMTGENPLVYDVDVWYKQPNYYRIALNNPEKKITQIVLRNDEGVFVLTPHLNKTFRFQSNWPQNQGQVYLFQTLAQSINEDQQRVFKESEDAFTFDVIANYQNSSLARQTIWLDKKTYAPKAVEVFDKNAVKLVRMEFTSFEFDFAFDDGAFKMQDNMTGWLDPQSENMSEPTNSSLADDAAQTNAQSAPQKPTPTPPSIGVVEPNYVPVGVVKKEMEEIKLGENKAMMLRYSGDYHFTLTQSHPETMTVSALNGQVVDLGYTLGVMLGEEQRTLSWTNDGVEFKLTTAEMPFDEMVKVAQSVQGQSAK
jgi:outer membrane lipoprotein-sorting protein